LPNMQHPSRTLMRLFYARKSIKQAGSAGFFDFFERQPHH